MPLKAFILLLAIVSVQITSVFAFSAVEELGRETSNGHLFNPALKAGMAVTDWQKKRPLSIGDAYPVPDIPVLSNRKVKRFIGLYTEKKRDLLQAAIDRSARYMKMIHRVFRKHNLPENLAYLAIVESNLNPKARSRANAVGLWQFMRKTGEMFDLYQSWWHDDRYDPEKSTVAAARYLKQLHNRFNGDWELAMAAYNSGSRRVRNAQRKAERAGKPQNYWHLDLPRETRGYVPAFYAVATIFANLESYGFTKVSNWEEEQTYKTIQVPGGVSIGKIANSLGLEHGSLTRLNPSLSKGITPATYASYEFKIPAYVGITTAHRSNLRLLEEQRVKFWRFHIAKKGDSLWSISRRYDVPIGKIKAYNRFRRKNLLRIGRRIILPIAVGIPVAKREESVEKLFAQAKNNLDKVPGITYTHKVQRGDTLWDISRKFNVSVRSIRNWNRSLLNRKSLQIGTRILIKLPPKFVENESTGISI